MPYSKDQKTAACIALACKDGKIPESKLKGASRSMYRGMTREQLEDYCKGPIKKPAAAR